MSRARRSCSRSPVRTVLPLPIHADSHTFLGCGHVSLNALVVLSIEGADERRRTRVAPGFHGAMNISRCTSLALDLLRTMILRHCQWTVRFGAAFPCVLLSSISPWFHILSDVASVSLCLRNCGLCACLPGYAAHSALTSFSTLACIPSSHLFLSLGKRISTLCSHKARATWQSCTMTASSVAETTPARSRSTVL
jgi:hypothetical protein